MGRNKAVMRIAVIDYETDPFLHGRVPKPFTVEFHSQEHTAVFWGDDCTEQLIDYLDTLPPYLIYAHNGGKFDFHFLHKYIDDPVLIIKSRIVQAKLKQHNIRDSYAIMPFPLAEYNKMKFDYNKMELENRERFKDDILVYLHQDCVDLLTLVTAFVKRFGKRLTIGGTAMREIKKLHPFPNQGEMHDRTFRPFYFGGRVECFDSGILPGPWKLIDVNSMYPKVMRDYNHPIGGVFDVSDNFPDDKTVPYFACIVARNKGALPCIGDDGNLSFNKVSGEFFACGHEINAAIKYGLIDIEEIKVCYISQEYVRFNEFVDIFYTEKAEHKRTGNKVQELFCKYVLNSGYGRTGINPRNFEDWIVQRDISTSEELELRGYVCQVEYDDINLWSKEAEYDDEDFCDVSIAASITSAARSVLLEGLQAAIDPIYCDTDSIICSGFNGNIDPYTLGAWDLELTADTIAIAGKKLYALYDGDIKRKISSKGGTLTLSEIKTIAGGGSVRYKQDAPTFSLRGETRFQTRTFKKTVVAHKS